MWERHKNFIFACRKNLSALIQVSRNFKFSFKMKIDVPKVFNISLSREDRHIFAYELFTYL